MERDKGTDNLMTQVLWEHREGGAKPGAGTGKTW